MKLLLHFLKPVSANHKRVGALRNLRFSRKCLKIVTIFLTADINTMLNKMSPKNFETITNSVVEILSKNKDNIKFFEFTIENIFMKAVTQAIYCKNYTEFIKILFDRKFNGDIVMEKCDKFKHILKEEEDTSRSYSKQVTKELQ